MIRNRQLFLTLGTTGQYLGAILEHRLAAIGIPRFLLGLVTHVRRHGPVAPSAISALTGVPATTLRDNVQRLVDRGLVRRLPNPDDGRSYLLELTTKGELMTRAADPALAEAYDALERHLPRPLDEYERLLGELNDALRAALAELAELEAAAPALR